MADVGTDHGLLPRCLLLEGRVPLAYALDLREGPLSAAARGAAADGLGEREGFLARRSDGLAALQPGQAQTATLAGLGGGLIAAILGRAGGHVRGAGGLRRIVASPNREPERVRRWAMEAGWDLIHEALVADRGHFYPVLTLEPRAPGAPAPTWSEADLRLGPLLRAARPPAYLAWIAAERQRIGRAIDAATPRASRQALDALRIEAEDLEAELARR